MRRRRQVATLCAIVLSSSLAGRGGDDETGVNGSREPGIMARSPYGNLIVPGVLGDVVYRRVGETELSLDAYVQKHGPARPAVIVVHGGGWTSGSRIARVGQLLEMLTPAGFGWVSIDYRLAPEHPFPAALDDLRAALAFVRAHAAELRVDPDRIALLGEDAGAHLALLLAAERPPGLKAVVSLGGVYDLRPLVGRDGLGRRLAPVLGTDPSSPEGQRALAAASPVESVKAGMAPTILVHGGDDSEVPLGEAAAYARALRQVGVESRVLEVPEGIHDPEDWHPDQWGYKAAVVKWLSRRLSLSAPEFEPFEDPHLTKNVAYDAYEASDGTTSDLLMDAWVPPGEGPFPAVVLAHGGGWEAGDKVTYLTPLFEPLARAGFAWFSIDYRLTPEHRHPEQLDDLRRAIRFVRHHARRFRVDPDRLAMVGESASGQMVALVASERCEGLADASDPVDRESCAVSAAVSFYGVYDLLPMVTDASPRSLLFRLFGRTILDDEGRELLRRYSPLYRVREGMPPLLLVHGTDELLWEQGLAMDRRLEEVGADHTLVRLDGAPHGMGGWEGHPEWTSYKTTLVSWLEDKLGPPQRVKRAR
jgi:acetyl esterase